MKLTDYFSRIEMDKLNRLPRTMRTNQIVIGIFIIFFMIYSVISLNGAITLGRENGIHGMINVLSLYHYTVQEGNSVPWYEVMIYQKLRDAQLQGGISLILLMLYFSRWKSTSLIKCWQILRDQDESEEIPEDKDF